MAITKFIPPQVPFQASDNLRAFLGEQMDSIAPLLNNAAQRNEDEVIEGDWTFNGILTANNFQSTNVPLLNVPNTFTQPITNNNNANIDGPNFIIDTINKSTSIFAYDVRRSGVSVGGILLDGRFVAAGSDAPPAALQSSLSANMLHLDGKEAVDGTDTFLRLNQNADFSGGVYIPGGLQVDGGINCGPVTNPGAGNFRAAGVMYIGERVAAAGTILSVGQLWVRSSDSALMYTSDSGIDRVVQTA